MTITRRDGTGTHHEYKYEVKDSGERMEFDSGMVRDVADGKRDYTLALDGPMFERWVEHLTKGAKKYSKRNWMKAASQGELDRFKESATRHFFQWLNGDTDEDHAAAVLFNINGAEYVEERLAVKQGDVRYDQVSPGYDSNLTATEALKAAGFSKREIAACVPDPVPDTPPFCGDDLEARICAGLIGTRDNPLPAPPPDTFIGHHYPNVPVGTYAVSSYLGSVLSKKESGVWSA